MDWLFSSKKRKNDLLTELESIDDILLNLRYPLLYERDYTFWDNSVEYLRLDTLFDYDLFSLFNYYHTSFFDEPKYTVIDEFESLFKLYNPKCISIDNAFESTRIAICSYRYSKDYYEKLTFIVVSNILKLEALTAASINFRILKLVVILVDKINSLLDKIKILEIKVLDKISTILNLSRSKFVLDLISRPPPSYKAF